MKGDEALAREALSYSVGIDLSSKELAEELNLSENLDPLNKFLEKSALRSEIKALTEEVKSKRARMKMANGTFYPQANFLGHYYAKRVGFQEPIDWDILFNVEIPIFQGGSNLAALRKSASEFKEAELGLNHATREIKSEIKRSYISFQSSLQQSKTLEEALKKSEESYKLQIQEYRLGLVNNLEVLQALNTMQETRRNLDRTITEVKLNYLVLKISVEELP